MSTLAMGPARALLAEVELKSRHVNRRFAGAPSGVLTTRDDVRLLDRPPVFICLRLRSDSEIELVWIAVRDRGRRHGAAALDALVNRAEQVDVGILVRVRTSDPFSEWLEQHGFVPVGEHCLRTRASSRHDE